MLTNLSVGTPVRMEPTSAVIRDLTGTLPTTTIIRRRETPILTPASKALDHEHIMTERRVITPEPLETLAMKVHIVEAHMGALHTGTLGPAVIMADLY